MSPTAFWDATVGDILDGLDGYMEAKGVKRHESDFMSPEAYAELKALTEK